MIILTTCGIAPASAAAAGQWYISGSGFTGTASTETTNATSATFTGSIGSTPIAWSCNHAKTSGTIKENNKDTSESILFSECKITEPATCKIPTTIGTVKLKSELLVESEKVYDKYEAAEGTKIVQVAISGCAIEAFVNLTGSIRCEEKNPKEEAVEKSCIFSNTSGSSLKIGPTSTVFQMTATTVLTGIWGFLEWLACQAALAC